MTPYFKSGTGTRAKSPERGAYRLRAQRRLKNWVDATAWCKGRRATTDSRAVLRDYNAVTIRLSE